MVKRKSERNPLLANHLSLQSLSNRNTAFQFDNAAYDDDGDSLDRFSLAESYQQTSVKKRSRYVNNNMILDSILLIVEYLQIFALIQSLSLKWSWPLTWTRSMSFLFIFNLDVWEIAKIASGQYNAAKGQIVASDAVAINYRVMLLIWLIALIVGCFLFFLAKTIFTNRLWTTSLNRLMSFVVIVAQILALPIGVQVGKLFWCVPVTNVLDVENAVVCWNAEHCIYVAVALIVVIAVFILYPIWLIKKISAEVVTSDPRRHEAYLQLKHCEQMFDLDSSWNERLFISFASYRRFWSYQRPIHHFIKLIILCFYAALFNSWLVQIGLIFAVLVLYLLISMIRLPYRVTSFNLPYLWGLLCLCCNAVIGTFQNIPGIQSVFLLPSYIEGELILINVAWLTGTLIFFIYFALRITGTLFPNRPLWPNMLQHGMDKLNKNTRRYMIAAVNGRRAVKRALSFPALLAPVHELAHQIQVVNALACEAEYLQDPLHSSLRDVLDNLIELHAKLAPQSIFAESLKAYVQTTVSKLMEVLPAFSRRLQQREFDLILVTPVRRRILLKMFAVACFIRTGREEPAHEHGVRKLWTAPDPRMMIYDEGFHEEAENESVINVEQIEIEEADERLAISEHSFGTFPTQVRVRLNSHTEV